MIYLLNTSADPANHANQNTKAELLFITLIIRVTGQSAIVDLHLLHSRITIATLLLCSEPCFPSLSCVLLLPCLAHDLVLLGSLLLLMELVDVILQISKVRA